MRSSGRRGLACTSIGLTLVASIVLNCLIGTPAWAATDTPATHDQLALLRVVNVARVAAGVRPLLLNAALNRAAQAHADYLLLNPDAYGYPGFHQEIAGRPGFTGVAGIDRVRAAGYTKSAAELGSGWFGGYVNAVGLLATVYHRHSLLAPDAIEIGYGGAVGRAGVVQVGSDWGLAPTTSVARYPQPGATNVVLTWDGLESPDPAPALPRPFGPPVTLNFPAAGATVALRDATLDGPRGRVTVRTEVTRDYNVSLLPLAPLDPNATYVVRFDLLQGGVLRLETWSFSTESGSVGPPANLRTTNGAFGRVVTWDPPAEGPPPDAYGIYRCTRVACDLGTNFVYADQRFFIDPDPTVAATYHVQAFHNGASATSVLSASRITDRVDWYESKWVEQSPYPTAAPGTIVELLFSFRNVGTVPWIRGVWGAQANLGLNGDNKVPYRLGMNLDWLWDDRVATTSEPLVRPGEIGTFRFKLRAPLTPGVYQFAVRPVVDGTVWLADEGVFLTLTVR